MEGFMQSKGVKKPKKQSVLTQNDLSEIKKLVDRDKKRHDRFSRTSSKG